jgi:hypothetical protein
MVSRHIINRLLVVPLLIIVMMIGVFVWRWHIDRQGRKQLEAVVGKLDETDPRWRWEHLEADRVPVPDVENSAFLVARFREAVGPKRNHFYPPSRSNGDSLSPWMFPTNRRLDDEAIALIDVALTGTDAAQTIVRLLEKQPHGRRTFNLSGNWRTTLLLPSEDPWPMQSFLELELERLAQANLPDQALRVVRAQLNLRRLYGDEPLCSSQSSRARLGMSAARLLERALGMGMPNARLAELQAEFAAEANADLFRIGVRAHRAMLDRAFRDCAADNASPMELVGCYMMPAPGQHHPLQVRYDLWNYSPHLTADHAVSLETLTQLLAVADLPEQQQHAALAAVPRPPHDGRHLISNEQLYHVVQLHETVQVSQARIRCAVVILAIERYRLLTGEWPPSLAAIPKAILTEVPSDPFSGKPLLYVRRNDSVTVYSVGFDGADDRGILRIGWSRDEVGVDIGLRLYNPDQRRLPPLPVKPADPDREGPRRDFGSEPRVVKDREP